MSSRSASSALSPTTCHELVSPDGIQGLTIEAPVLAANRAADEMKAAGVDIVVLLVHEGAATTDVSSATDPASDMGKIVNGADENIDAIISGHTHLAYNHAIAVPQWLTEAAPSPPARWYRPGSTATTSTSCCSASTRTPVRSLGVQQSDPAAHHVDHLRHATGHRGDAELPGGCCRAGHRGQGRRGCRRCWVPSNWVRSRDRSTGPSWPMGPPRTAAGNPPWATWSPMRSGRPPHRSRVGSAKIAFMNPGGLRQDMVGNPGGYPAALTYQQAAVVQPFANTLVNMSLTGAQIRAALEQQWQPAGRGSAVPAARHFQGLQLHL